MDFEGKSRSDVVRQPKQSTPFIHSGKTFFLGLMQITVHNPMRGEGVRRTKSRKIWKMRKTNKLFLFRLVMWRWMEIFWFRLIMFEYLMSTRILLVGIFEDKRGKSLSSLMNEHCLWKQEKWNWNCMRIISLSQRNERQKVWSKDLLTLKLEIDFS